MNKVIASVLQVGIALAVLACLFFQIVVLPQALADEARLAPFVAALHGLLLTVTILGLVCVEVILVATAVLAQLSKGEGIFSRRAFVWVDVIIVALLVGAALSLVLLVGVAVTPVADLGPEAGDMVDVGLYLLGLAGAGAGVGIALLVFVLRSLLRRAVTLHDELAEVV